MYGCINISNIHTSYIYYFKDLEGIIIVSLKSQFPWVIFSSIGQVHIWGNLKESFSRIIIENIIKIEKWILHNANETSKVFLDYSKWEVISLLD